MDAAVKDSVWCVYDETYTHLCDVVHDRDLKLQIHKTLVRIRDLIVQHVLKEQTHTHKSHVMMDEMLQSVSYECDDCFTRSDPLSQNSNTPKTPQSNFAVP